MSAVTYRVWFAVADRTGTDGAAYGPSRTTFVVYEGPDRRHAKRVARNLASTHVTNRVPTIALVESGWEVIDR